MTAACVHERVLEHVGPNGERRCADCAALLQRPAPDAARVRHVTVDVYEDDKRVKQLSISYFDSQPYTVQIVTPDGVDAQAERTVGDA